MARTVRGQERKRTVITATPAEKEFVRRFLSLSQNQVSDPDPNLLPLLFEKKEKQGEVDAAAVFSPPFSTAILPKRKVKPLNLPSFYKPEDRVTVCQAPPAVVTPDLALSLISTYYPKLWHR